MRIRGVPVFVVFLGLLAALMLLPSLHGLIERDWRVARLFLFASVFTSFCAGVLGAATQGGREGGTLPVRAELLTIVAVFALAPVFAAIPIWLIAPGLGWAGAYFESVSSLTTTGATLFEHPNAVPPQVHLWRALLGWTGGFATLVIIGAVIVPRELLDMPGNPVAGGTSSGAEHALALEPGGARVLKAARLVAPVYGALTLATAAVLESAGSSPLAAICHAMGMASTSGISPVEGGFGRGGAGRVGEMIATCACILAATRFLWRGAMRRGRRIDPRRRRLRSDPEIRLMAISVGLAAFGIFAAGLAHRGLDGLIETPGFAFQAFWGALSTSIGFLSTTGYTSADWGAAMEWSNAQAIAPLLLGLAMLGGGVASTAGGIKLFRAYLLWRHGTSEVIRLVHPHVVDTTRTEGGDVVQQMIRNAWVLMMLAMAALAATLAAMTLTGLDYAAGLAAAIASLSNVGPLLPVAAELEWTEIPPAARAVGLAAMVLGRIELLAAVALLNPDYWRR